MPHEPVLITTIAIALSVAFAGALVARRLRLPLIVGYLVAGVLIGPFTPGFVADQEIATELAELGVILLMFGVGLEFSVRDLLAVRRIAVPGAVAQITVATFLGTLLGIALGWGLGGGLVLGLSISVASTVVLLRALESRNELDSAQGRIAVGWLIVEDIFTVGVLVLLPTVAPVLGGTSDVAAGPFGPIGELGLALAKAAMFGVLMVVVGTRVVPALLSFVAREGSRELFTLGVLGIALGIAYLSSELFGVSFALGAFLAGVVVSESDVSHQAAADALPLRDAFAVLFFVSVGMLVDPAYLLAHPVVIVALTAIVVVAKAVAALVIVALAGYPSRVGLTVAAGLAQVGEFSFILGTLGVSLGLLPPEALQLIVAGALISITLNPLVFRMIDPFARRLASSRLYGRLQGDSGPLTRLPVPKENESARRGHAIICGYGRVGTLLAAALARRGFEYVVISNDRREVERLRGQGVEALYGDASNPAVLTEARVGSAVVFVIAMRDAHGARLAIDRVTQMNPRVSIIARTHSQDEATRLRAVGGRVQPVYGELELAAQLARYTLRRFGVSLAEAEAIAQGLRRQAGL